MSNLEAVTKAANQLFTRIFDQRQFTHGEINYLMKELGNDSNFEKNFDSILKMNENLELINDKYSGDMCKSHDNIALNICDKVAKLLQRTEAIVELETDKINNSDRPVDQDHHIYEKHEEKHPTECNTRSGGSKESIDEEESELE